MGKVNNHSDQVVMARLRKPIDELVEGFCANKTESQKLRLRQLAWQAVDVLARIGNVADLVQEKDIKRITRDIKKLGASDQFVEESLVLAKEIYRQMKVHHPGLLKKYSGG